MSGRRESWTGTRWHKHSLMIQISIFIFICISIAGSSLVFLPRVFWWQELNAGFACYYLVAHVLGLLVILLDAGLCRKRIRIFCGFLLVVLIACYVISLRPFYVKHDIQVVADMKQEGQRLRFFFVNLNGSGEWGDSLLNKVRELHPDLMLSLYDSGSIDKLGPVSWSFPYQRASVDHDMGMISLYSRYPFVGESRGNIGEDFPAVLISKLQIPGTQALSVAAMRLWPTRGDESMAENDVLVRRMGTQLRYLDGPVIFGGAFHVNEFSEYYRVFRYLSRTENSASGFGNMRTWNSRNPLLRFTLDHVFSKGPMRVLRFETHEIEGAAHKGVMVDYDVASSLSSPAGLGAE